MLNIDIQRSPRVIIEAMGRATDLRGPEEAQLPGRVLVRPQIARVVHAGALAPQVQLLGRQAPQLFLGEVLGCAWPQCTFDMCAMYPSPITLCFFFNFSYLVH